MLNYFEFEGELISFKRKEGDKQGSLWLEGLTPSGYTTAVTFETSDDIIDELVKAGKHDRISICGHIEVRSRMSATDKLRKRTILVTDKVITIKDNNGYEID